MCSNCALFAQSALLSVAWNAIRGPGVEITFRCGFDSFRAHHIFQSLALTCQFASAALWQFLWLLLHQVLLPGAAQ